MFYDSSSKTLEGLEPMRDFQKIDRQMSVREGMKILAHRLGLSGGRIRALVRDRYPSAAPIEERRSLKTFKIKCFVQFDITFSDVLHVGYDEMKFLGLGRRFLINRILRAVVAGTCDSVDGTGVSGDFPPVSWFGIGRAGEIRAVQGACIGRVKNGDARLLKSIKVRLGRTSAGVLLGLAANCDKIRSAVRRHLKSGGRSGLRCLSDMLVAYRKKFNYKVRMFDEKNRKRSRKRRRKYRLDQYADGRMSSSGTKNRCKGHMGYCILTMGLTDLRKLIDPAVPSWHRRPTDEDWLEGSRTGSINTRKPVTLKRRALFRRHGLGDVPGITVPVSAEALSSLRTDWKISEVRDIFSKTPKEGD